MAYYNYKRVCHREDFAAEVKVYDADAEKDGNDKYEGTVDYDGDGWIIAERLLDKKDATIAALREALLGCALVGPGVRDGPCWCPAAARGGAHRPFCLTARAALSPPAPAPKDKE